MILPSTDQLSSKPVRIVSLVPSQTELLHYLGLETETIAITKFCIHPIEWFRNKTRIGGTKSVDIEKIISLKPDLIIANKEENVKDQVEMLAENFPVWVTDVNNISDAYQMIHDIGALTRKENESAKLIDIIKFKFHSVIQSFSTNKSIPASYLIWKDPYMTIGGDSFISNMMETAGLNNVFKDQARYPEVTVSQLEAVNCDLVLLSSEPYPFKQKHVDELQEQLPGIKIMLVDGEMFSWYGSRLLFAPEYFMELHQRILMG